MAMSITSEVGGTDIMKPKLSVGWFIGAVVGFILLIVAFIVAKKITDTGASVVAKVPAVATQQTETVAEFLMG